MKWIRKSVLWNFLVKSDSAKTVAKQKEQWNDEWRFSVIERMNSKIF